MKDCWETLGIAYQELAEIDNSTICYTCKCFKQLRFSPN